MIETQYTIREAAEILRVSVSTLYQRVNRGTIAHTKPATGKRVLIPESALQRYLDGGAGRACRVKAGAR